MGTSEDEYEQYFQQNREALKEARQEIAKIYLTKGPADVYFEILKMGGSNDKKKNWDYSIKNSRIFSIVDYTVFLIEYKALAKDKEGAENLLLKPEYLDMLASNEDFGETGEENIAKAICEQIRRDLLNNNNLIGDKKIILCPRYLSKKELTAKCEELGVEYPEIAVETEYGDEAIEGSKFSGLHHVPDHIADGAPSGRDDIPLLKDGGTLAVSHMDMDTFVTVLKCLGVKMDENLSKAVGYLDENGFNLHKIPEDIVPQDKKEVIIPQLIALRKLQTDVFSVFRTGRGGIEGVTDVTSMFFETVAVPATGIIDGDKEIMNNATEWYETRNSTIKKYECGKIITPDGNGLVRVFVSDGKENPTSEYIDNETGTEYKALVTYFKNTGGFSIGIANGIEIGLESLLKEQYPTQGGARGNAGFINNGRGGAPMPIEDLPSIVKLIADTIIERLKIEPFEIDLSTINARVDAERNLHTAEEIGEGIGTSLTPREVREALKATTDIEAPQIDPQIDPQTLE